ncbi:MAG TPA: dephospho-CoA kinase [Thermotogota bacterium]|nr:dephospho-CoA kinase [Thermotogota bacterium]
MKSVGICGGIASGKTTLTRALERLGFPVVFVDRIGHQALEQPTLRTQLEATFGPTIMDSAGQVDRRALGRVVFGAPAQMAKLNAIVHPWMVERVQQQLHARQQQGYAHVVVEAAVLYTMGLHTVVQAVVYVFSPVERRVEWLKARNHMQREQALQRIAQEDHPPAAHPPDLVVRNDGSLGQLVNGASKVAEWVYAGFSPRGWTLCTSQLDGL